MARGSQNRFYVTMKNTSELLALYRGKDLDALTRFTVTLLRAAQDRPPPTTDRASPPAAASSEVASSELFSGLRAVSAQSLDWRAAFAPPLTVAARAAAVVSRDITPDELVIAYEIADPDDARSILQAVNDHRGVPLDANGNAFLSGGFDPGGSIADHWCPGSANLAVFGHRDHARRTVRARALTESAFLGQRVNVVIIDEGLDKSGIPPESWGGGLDHFIDNDLVLPAGTAPRNSHGMMIARSILDLAPQARLYDVPAVSLGATPLPVFVSTMHTAFSSLIHAINHQRELPRWSGPWVLVNAWGIFDTSADPSGGYTKNMATHGHPMINLVTHAVRRHRLDVIFAAGNCGEFCPSQRCGGRDRGPGHSIWGANAHPLVITAGSVRSDETWVGYSSQGPGPALLAIQKPDICAPSQFCETRDAASVSSGTSASCAITAGVVAALRGNPKWDQVTVTPEALKAALIAGARKPYGPAGWDGRLGFGIIDAGATIAALPH